MAQERFEVEVVSRPVGKSSYNVIFVDSDGNRHVIGTCDRRGPKVSKIIQHFVYGKGSLGGSTGGLLTSPVDPWPGRQKSPLWAAILANMREDTG